MARLSITQIAAGIKRFLQCFCDTLFPAQRCSFPATDLFLGFSCAIVSRPLSSTHREPQRRASRARRSSRASSITIGHRSAVAPALKAARAVLLPIMGPSYSGEAPAWERAGGGIVTMRPRNMGPESRTYLPYADFPERVSFLGDNVPLLKGCPDPTGGTPAIRLWLCALPDICAGVLRWRGGCLLGVCLGWLGLLVAGACTRACSLGGRLSGC
jgi:hypothetical protein